MSRFSIALHTFVLGLFIMTSVSTPAQEQNLNDDEQSVSTQVRHPQEDGFSWMNGYSLITTKNRTIDEANATVDFISEHGGQIAIMVSPRLLLGWIPESLIGQAGVVKIYHKAVPPGLLKNLSSDEADGIAFYNDVANGTLKSKKLTSPSVPALQTQVSKPLATTSGTITPQTFNAEVMTLAGRINLNVFFVESAGGIDPNQYSWTCADMATMVSEVNAGLSFWSSKASTYGVPLTFVTNYYKPRVGNACGGTSAVLTNYEPILHPLSDRGKWMEQIMCNLQFCTGYPDGDVDSFDLSRTAATMSNWAISLFIAYNPSPAPTAFSDGYSNAGGLTAPATHMLFRNGSFSITDNDIIAGHLIGLHYGAEPEIGNGSCDTGYYFNHYVVNANAPNCNPKPDRCIMRFERALCAFTAGQVGWGLNITSVKTSTSPTGIPEKKTWIPGEDIYYVATIDLPGPADQCWDVHADWYIHTINTWGQNSTEHFTTDTSCGVKSGGTQTVSLKSKVAGNGEGLVVVGLSIYLPIYDDTGHLYGRGLQTSSRGRFFVTDFNATANK